jgi:hypothetical protein
VHLESEAVIAILGHIENNEWQWVSSKIVDFEIDQTSDFERKTRLKLMTRIADECPPIDLVIHLFAKKIIVESGFDTYDALHLAVAKRANCNVFLSTDDKLVKAAKSSTLLSGLTIDNPLNWLQKVL